MERLRHIREQSGYSQQELADESGVSQHTISEIELGRRKPQGRTLRKLAKAMGVEVADLRGGSDYPLGKAQPSPQLTLNGALEEERRPAWESAVESAQQLREDGQERMEELLSTWHTSKERGDPYAVRRSYLDAMGTLLRQAYDAETALVAALSSAHLTDQWPEVQKAVRFYIELWRLVQQEGLSIHTDGEQTDERTQSERRPDRVEEPRAA